MDEVARSAARLRQLRLAATALTALLLLIGALGIEGLARLYWEDAWRDPTRHGGPEGVELPVYEGILDLARANSQAIHRNVYHRTNSRGIRGPEARSRPRPGVFRIAVAGDSITMGAGVLEEDRYTNQLQTSLGDGFEVLNFGLSGQNTDEVVTRLDNLSQHYKSHLFIYGFTLNDIEGKSYRTAVTSGDFAESYWSRVARAERSPSYFWRFLIAWWLGRSSPSRHDPILENYSANPPAWQELLAGLDRFAELARTRAVCGHVLVHADLHELNDEHPYLEIYDRVEKASLQRGLTVTQSFPLLAERQPDRAKALWVSPFDPHPNRVGHALIAEALHEGIEKLPPRCLKRHSTRLRPILQRSTP